MDFQTTLPYAADSDLHVIEGLDVTGTPIYQRTGLGRFLPVDMYTLLQGIIERCLATQLPDGSYLVSPTIFDETMFSTTDYISYAPISQWTERTYPSGVLNEVSGYVKNLMDNYPQYLLLLAIDDKLWELGNSGAEGKSLYGNLKDTAPYWEAFHDITYAMTQAGVGFDPITFEMVLIPARVSGTGSDVYGAPNAGVRMYPEVLIARYKVMQQLRYKRASISDTRRYTGSAIGRTDQTAESLWTDGYASGRYVLCIEAARDYFATHQDVGDVQNPDALGYFYIYRGFMAYLQTYGQTHAIWSDGYAGQSKTHDGPKFLISKGYASIPHDVKIWANWDGSGDLRLWQQFGGEPLVLGQNLLLDVPNISADYSWQAGFEIPENILQFPPYITGYMSWYWNPMYNGSLTIQAEWPIEDWEFQFCKHDDNGGVVTWTA